MTHLSINSLGTLQISLDNAPILNFSSNKARALLVYLAVESHAFHPRGKLAALFWPDYSEGDARHSLRQVLSNVRHVIGDRAPQDHPYLDVSRQNIRFNPDSDYWLDVDLFSTLPSSQNPVQDIPRFENAIGAYRGSFLEGFTINDAPLFEEWLLVQRERWHRIAIETLIRIIASYTDLDATDKALYYAWQLLDLDPWREDAHRRVMRLLTLVGQRTAALVQFETCCDILMKELDTTPERETVVLYEAIKSGRLESPGADRIPVDRTIIRKPTHNLPAQIMPCIGRDDEITSLKMLLQNDDCRLITLVGPGGIGKTRLAIEVANTVLADYADGVFLVTLIALKSSQSVIPSIAQSLGFSFSDKAGSQSQQLVSYLKSKHMLLILDNAEHLVSGQNAVKKRKQEPDSFAEILGVLLETAPEVKIVVTSRVILNILGENTFPVRALSYPRSQPENLGEMRHFSAVRLFQQGARSLRPDFKLDETNFQSISDICQVVQGLPLAVLLTTSWITTLSIPDIAVSLQGNNVKDQGLNLLETDWVNIPARHRSLRTVFEHSWQLLSENVQKVSLTLSVFGGAIKLSEIRHITGAGFQDIRMLVNASFLDHLSPGFYTMQELLRQFVAAKLAENPVEKHNAHKRHCEYYIQALQDWAEDAKGPRQQDVLDEMDKSIENARSAWNWAVSQGNIAYIDRALQGLCLFYLRRVRNQEGESACRAAVDKLESMDDPEKCETGGRLRVLSKVLTWQSRLQPLEQAVKTVDRSLKLLDATELSLQDVRAERADALHQKGFVLASRNLKRAIHYCQHSLALFRKINAQWEESNVLFTMGYLHWSLGEYERSRKYYEKSHSIAQTCGNLRGMTDATLGLGVVAMNLGEAEKAVQLGEENLKVWRRMGDLFEISYSLQNLALLYTNMGRISEALPLLEESRIITCDILGLSGGYVHSKIAWVRLMMGDYKSAFPLGQTALKIMEQDHDMRGIAWSNLNLGGTALGLAEFTQAEDLLRSSVEVYRLVEQRQELSFALAFLSYALWAQEKMTEIRSLLEEVLNIWKAIKSPQSLMFALSGMALISLSQNKLEYAIELYALASTLNPCIEKYPWFWDVIERHINHRTASLSPDVISAARERGLALDINTTVEELLQVGELI